MCNVVNDINNTPKINTPTWKDPGRNWPKEYYRVWDETIPSQNDYIEMKKQTTKIIKDKPLIKKVLVSPTCIQRNKKT